MGAFVNILSQNVDILHHSPQQRLLNRSSGLFFETYSACLALFLDNLNHEIFSKKIFYERKFQKALFWDTITLQKGLVSLQNDFFCENCHFWSKIWKNLNIFVQKFSLFIKIWILNCISNFLCQVTFRHCGVTCLYCLFGCKWPVTRGLLSFFVFSGSDNPLRLSRRIAYLSFMNL